MKLTKYGRAQWLSTAVVLLPAAIVLGLLEYYLFASLALLVWIGIAAFFRDPDRVIPTGDGLFVSPADGRVTDVSRVRDTDETRHLGCEEAIRVSIFLSVLNVHINRAPCHMTIRDRIYRPGRFMNALNPESGTQNESNTMIADANDENNRRRLIVKQISGKIARRIVCEAVPNDILERGEPYGMIKFGSRTELYLPAAQDLDVVVKDGDRVKGGSTVLVRLREAEGVGNP